VADTRTSGGCEDRLGCRSLTRASNGLTTVRHRRGISPQILSRPRGAELAAGPRLHLPLRRSRHPGLGRVGSEVIDAHASDTVVVRHVLPHTRGRPSTSIRARMRVVGERVDSDGRNVCFSTCLFRG
jgi:hypothetical protein